MLLIEIKNGEPTTNKIDFIELRRLYPNVSFTLPLDSASLAYDFGFAEYKETTKPDDSTAEKYFKFTEVPVLKSDGSYEQVWQQTPMIEEEKLEADILKMREVSIKRSKLLIESDWTQLPDVTLFNKEAWAAYRKSLRDISTQPGYPWTIEWPITPNINA
jgi:hypothetical protein